MSAFHWETSKLACSGGQQVWPVYLAEPGVVEGHHIGHQVEFEDIECMLYGVFWVCVLWQPGCGQHIQRCNAGLRGLCYVCAIAALRLRKRGIMIEGRSQRTQNLNAGVCCCCSVCMMAAILLQAKGTAGL